MPAIMPIPPSKQTPRLASIVSKHFGSDLATRASLAKTTMAALLSISIAGCGQGGHNDHGGMPPAMVTYEVVVARDIPAEYEYVGQTNGSREVEIRARVNGIIEKRLYDEGATVKAGQPLFRLESSLYAAAAAQTEAGLATADANLKQAEREYTRLKPLIEARAISQKEWDGAASSLDIAKAQFKQAQAQFASSKVELGYTYIKAPISGVIGRALKMEGSLANAANDSLLATMAQIDPMHVNFAIAERDRNELQSELAAGALKLAKTGFTVKLKNSEGQLLKATGKMNFSDYKADANTGAYAARAEIANADNALTPGQFVRVVLTGASHPAAIALPQRAVLDGPQGKYVYVVGKGKDGKPAAEPHPIVPGEWVALDGQEKNGWIIRQGVRAGDQVIVDGTARIFAPGQPIVPMTAAEAKKAAAAEPAPAAGKPETSKPSAPAKN